MNITNILAAFDEIAQANHWEPLHTPQNLAAALHVESAELLAEIEAAVKYKNPAREQPGDEREHIGDEVADVFLYLCVLCRSLDLDLETVVMGKIAKNRERFLPR